MSRSVQTCERALTLSNWTPWGGLALSGLVNSLLLCTHMCAVTNQYGNLLSTPSGMQCGGVMVVPWGGCQLV
jgi:hypothetical protein